MKKIIFVCMGLGVGGTEKTLVEAVNALDKSKNDITVYLRKPRIDLVKKISSEVHVIVNHRTPVSEKMLCKLGGITVACEKMKLEGIERKISKKIRQYILKKRNTYEMKIYFQNKRYDYAVAYDMAEECLKFVLGCVNAKKKIAFFHASCLYDTKARLYKQFDSIVGVNDLVAQNIKEDYPEISSRVFAVENYLDPNWVLSDVEKSDLILRPNCDVLLCTCGRISNEKGFDIAAYAAKYLSDNGVKFHWFFVGDGVDRKRIEDIIKDLDIVDHVTITGFKKNPYRYMELCDIYIQPSYEESYGMAIAEAMILKKPIISTKTVGGTYFNENYKCCVLSDKEPKRLAETIKKLYLDRNKLQEIQDYENVIDYGLLKEVYTNKINELFV